MEEEGGRIFGARISTVVATAIFNRADVGESVRVRGWGGEGQRQSADRHRTTDAPRRGGWPGRVKGETGLLMESHCSLIKSFARRREGARRGAIVHGGGEREGTASETETKENGGRGGTGARQQVCIRSSPSTLPNGPRTLILYSSDRNRLEKFYRGFEPLKGWPLIKYTVQEYHFGILGS